MKATSRFQQIYTSNTDYIPLNYLPFANKTSTNLHITKNKLKGQNL